MIRSDLVRRVATKRGIEIARAELVVDEILKAIASSLRRGERVEIRGLGSFSVRHYRGYRGRNPKSGNAIVVKAKRLPHFKPSKNMSESINAGPMTTSPAKLSGVARVPKLATTRTGSQPDMTSPSI